jgi:hypothetical protein
LISQAIICALHIAKFHGALDLHGCAKLQIWKYHVQDDSTTVDWLLTNCRMGIVLIVVNWFLLYVNLRSFFVSFVVTQIQIQWMMHNCSYKCKLKKLKKH